MQKLPKKKKKKIENIIVDYFTNRPSITLTFVLIDIRLNPQKIDIEFMNWLNENNILFKIIFTKTDKLNKSEKETKADNYINKIINTIKLSPKFIVSSSKNKSGRKEILNKIQSLN